MGTDVSLGHTVAAWPSLSACLGASVVSITLGRISADRWHHCYSDPTHVALKASEDTRKKKPARGKSSDAVLQAIAMQTVLGEQSSFLQGAACLGHRIPFVV